MTEKRFELTVNQHNQCDIIDLVESKEKNAICIYNDLGNYHFSSAKAVCELLNKLHEKNKELQERNNRQCKQLDDLYRLVEQKDWRALTDILDDFKKADEQLQKENKELKVTIGEMEDYLARMEEENKELKSLCKVLIKHIEKNSIAFVIDEEVRRLLE